MLEIVVALMIIAIIVVLDDMAYSAGGWRNVYDQYINPWEWLTGGAMVLLLGWWLW